MKIQNNSLSPDIAKSVNNLGKATAEDFKLEKFLREAIENKLKGNSLKKFALESGIVYSYPSILNKLKSYKDKGISGIVRKERKDSDELRSFSNEVLQRLQHTYSESQSMLDAYESTHKWLRDNSAKFIFRGAEYDIANGNLYEVNDAKTIMLVSALYTDGIYLTEDGDELKIGSYRSAARYLSDLKQSKADQLHFKRFGLHSYRLKRQRSINLNYSNLLPNDLWSGDNKRLDILVIDWDWKSVFVPWLSGFYDLATRRYIYELTKSANSKSISNALCKAFKQWGIPKEINSDNGKDYIANRINNLLQSLNIKQRHSINYNAKAKPVESFHNIIDNKTKVLPGYIGNRYDVMPEETKILSKEFLKVKNLHNLYDKNIHDEEIRITLNGNLEGKLRKSKKRFLHISEFIQKFEEILSEYESTVQGGLKKDKLGRQVYDRLCKDELINEFGEKLNTPSGRYDYKCRQGFIPTLVQDEIISLFAMNQTLRTVQLKGIAFRDQYYFSPKLKEYIGKKVLIKYLDTDSAYVYIFSSDFIQKIQTDSIFNKLDQDEVNKDLKFIDVADRIKVYDYGDNKFIEQLKEQRAEEKQIKETIGVTRLTGLETTINEIKEAELELISKKQKINKLKSHFDD